MANEIVGAKSHLFLYQEASWGTAPGTPERIILPVTDYGVQLQPETRESKPFVGLFQRKYSKRFRGIPQGTLVTEAYAYEPTPTTGTTGSDLGVSLAEFILDWGMFDEASTIHELTDLPSMGAEWTEGPGVADQLHTGLRVNAGTLAGSDGGPITISYDLMGQEIADLAAAQALPTDMEDLGQTAMGFEDIVFSLDDGAAGAEVLLQLRSFSLVVTHSLSAKYNNSNRPSLLLKIDRDVVLTIEIDKNSDTYDDLFWTDPTQIDFVGTLVIQGLNNGTGAAAWTIGSLSFPQLRLTAKPDSRSRDDIFGESLTFRCMKPDTVSNDVAIVWTTGASADAAAGS
ncbi:hypothetical protein KAR91_20140 [Candidatus Pacearchaeota archaeon]|nr:hypothetical protein [Candidatus Pacearchaeota archaeon]